jgi:phosphocarrier protein
MTESWCVVQNLMGLHIRPASMIVAIANKTSCKVSLWYNDVEANAKSIMSLLRLGLQYNDRVLVRVEGENETAILKQIELLFATMFDVQDS